MRNVRVVRAERIVRMVTSGHFERVSEVGGQIGAPSTIAGKEESDRLQAVPFLTAQVLLKPKTRLAMP